MIVDTSGLLAFFNSGEPAHEAAVAAVASATSPLVVSPFVIAELDYLLLTRLGVDAELLVLAELSAGAWHLVHVDQEQLSRIKEIVSRYRDQGIGVADASLVFLADRFGTRRVLTLDHRHFDVLRPLSGGRFQIVP